MIVWRGCGATVTLYPAIRNIIGIITLETLALSSKFDNAYMIQQISFQRERICVCVYLHIGTKRQTEESFIAALLIRAKYWN